MVGPSNGVSPKQFGREAAATQPESTARTMSAADARLLATVAESDEALPLQCAYRWEKERANSVFLTQPSGGNVRNWTWAEAMDEVRRVAGWISRQNWEPGSRIAILSKNCG